MRSAPLLIGLIGLADGLKTVLVVDADGEGARRGQPIDVGGFRRTTLVRRHRLQRRQTHAMAFQYQAYLRSLTADGSCAV
jgi:hypothetical protein